MSADPLLPAAQELATQLGRTPGLKVLKSELNIGEGKAKVLRDLLNGEGGGPLPEAPTSPGMGPVRDLPGPAEGPYPPAPVPPAPVVEDGALVQGPVPRLKRVRWAVRGVLVLGVTVSVIANVLHANDNVISRSIAAWPPLALLLTIELIGRVPTASRSLSVTRIGATTVIAGIAAWVSYWHMAGVASRYGEVGAAPYLIPFSVDGLIVVASVSLVELGGRIRRATDSLEVAA